MGGGWVGGGGGEMRWLNPYDMMISPSISGGGYTVKNLKFQ